MSSATRTVLSLIIVIVVPWLVLGEAIAGGGAFPSFPPDLGLTQFDTSEKITAVIVLDPNGPVPGGFTFPPQAPDTLTGSFATIAITRKHVGTAVAPFQVEPFSSLGELRFGCNLLLTNPRFLEFSPGVPGLPLGGPSTFSNWLPADVTKKLFAQLGITLEDATTFEILRVPGVAEIVSQDCEPFPRAKDALEFLPFVGVLMDGDGPDRRGREKDSRRDGHGIKLLPPLYPDRTIVPEPGLPPIPPEQQWFPGFLVLKVKVGFWVAPAVPTP